MLNITAVSGYHEPTRTFSPDFKIKMCTNYQEALRFLAENTPLDILGRLNKPIFSHQDIELDDSQRQYLGVTCKAVTVVKVAVEFHKIGRI